MRSFVSITPEHPIPIVNVNDVKGGVHIVKDITERNNIASERRVEGMLVVVITDTSPFSQYQLKGGTTNTHWVLYTSPGSGGVTNPPYDDTAIKNRLTTIESNYRSKTVLITPADLTADVMKHPNLTDKNAENSFLHIDKMVLDSINKKIKDLEDAVAGGITPPDTTSPTVSNITPTLSTSGTSTGTEIAVDGTMVITFDEAMNTTVGSISLNGTTLTGGTWSTDKKTYTVSYSGLTNDTTYTVTISGFKDTAGNTIVTDTSNCFKTEKIEGPIMPNELWALEFQVGALGKKKLSEMSGYDPSIHVVTLGDFYGDNLEIDGTTEPNPRCIIYRDSGTALNQSGVWNRVCRHGVDEGTIPLDPVFGWVDYNIIGGTADVSFTFAAGGTTNYLFKIVMMDS